MVIGKVVGESLNDTRKILVCAQMSDREGYITR